MTDDAQLRKQAKNRLNAQKAFKTMLGGFVILWAICWAIWFFTDEEKSSFPPWPVWVMFGTGIAAAFGGWNAYGPRDQAVSDADIDREVKRMKE